MCTTWAETATMNDPLQRQRTTDLLPDVHTTHDLPHAWSIQTQTKIEHISDRLFWMRFEWDFLCQNAFRLLHDEKSRSESCQFQWESPSENHNRLFLTRLAIIILLRSEVESRSAHFVWRSGQHCTGAPLPNGRRASRPLGYSKWDISTQHWFHHRWCTGAPLPNRRHASCSLVDTK